MFPLDAHQTTVRTKLFAGLTTFLTMAYIIFVNPDILSIAGMDKNAVFVATCLVAAFGSLVMGFYANYPIALAPGMGLNAFFTFGVVKGMGVSWEIALAAVLISGVLFVILSVLPFREWIINSIPKSQKLAIAAGIGLFLGFIGLKSAGLVVDHPATLVQMGDLVSLKVLLAVLGFIVIVALDYKKIPGAIIIGILLVAVVGMMTDLAKAPTSIVSMPPDPLPTFLALDMAGFFELAGATMLILVFSFLLVDMFDTAGTLIGLGHQAKMLDKDGNLPNIGKALVTDSSATIAGAIFRTSSTTSYIESASGIRARGRTGLTALAAAGCFLLALFFAPVATSVPAFATATAIVFVACMMARELAEIDWDDVTEFVHGVIIALTMPLTFSIATGIGLGFISYVGIKLTGRRLGDISAAMWLVLITFLIYFLAV
jgi:AGZA family xanthine/uracil permease-like MFS transporter